MRFLDVARQSGKVRETKDGFLVADVRCARTGIQEYSGSEMGRDEDVIRVYRPESEVFARDSMATFAGKPATDDHPPESVTSKNWKKYAVGNIGEDVARDGDYIRVPLILMDEGVIKKVRGGKCELSMGYEMDIAFEQGETPDGQQYDAVMSNLSMNHIAVVDRGRAGAKARIGDSWIDKPATGKPKPNKPQSTKPEPVMDLRKILVDGFSVETTDAGVEAINKLQSKIETITTDAATAATDAKNALDEAKQTAKDEAGAVKTAHESEIKAKDNELAEKDKELGAKDTEIKALKDAQVTPEQLDKLVADRSALIGKASQIVKDADFTGKPDAEIIAMAVDAHFGEGATKDKSEDRIFGMFDAIEVKPTDKFREVMRDKDPAHKDVQDHGQSAYEKRLENAWKDEAAA